MLKEEVVYNMVNRIPIGSVATYGQIAKLIAYPKHARQVGFALAALKNNKTKGVCWHRVVNSKGEISQRGDHGSSEFQRLMLEDEGIVFSLNGRIALKHYLWNPEELLC